jgi:phosphoglycolate phosphatase-like HAD superfamily hydrolase
MSYLLIDLDEVLVSVPRPYQKNSYGRTFVADHIDKVPFTTLNSDLVQLCLDFHKKEKVAIVTNSPWDYADSLLEKIGLDEIPVVSSANKPYTESIERHLKRKNLDPSLCLMVGDRGTDMFAANKLMMTKIGVLGGYNSEEQLRLAGAGEVCTNDDDLVKTIGCFEYDILHTGVIPTPPRGRLLEEPKTNLFFEDQVWLGRYTPQHLQKSAWVNRVFMFKNCRDHTMADITNDCRDDYFYNGKVRKGDMFISNIEYMLRKMPNALDKLDLKGPSWIVAAPNAYPSYCYRSDINQEFVNLLKEDSDTVDFFDDDQPESRVITRWCPRRDGKGSTSYQYESLGVARRKYWPANIIIFDDVITNGSQMIACGDVLRNAGFSGDLYALSIGRTVTDNDGTLKTPKEELCRELVIDV